MPLVSRDDVVGNPHLAARPELLREVRDRGHQNAYGQATVAVDRAVPAEERTAIGDRIDRNAIGRAIPTMSMPAATTSRMVARVREGA